MIVATSANGVIGRDNRLPWHLPADLQHFKKITMGKPMIMGRKTWESLPGLLPGRKHIVVTRDRNYVAQGATLAHSIDEAIATAGEVDEVMVIGGANLYQQALEIADTLYLTLIDITLEGDASFPAIDMDHWQQESIESHCSDEKNQYNYSFLTYRRS